MKKSKRISCLISLLLVGAIALNLGGCVFLPTNSNDVSETESDTQPMDEDNTESDTDAPTPGGDVTPAPGSNDAVVTDFALRLFNANNTASDGQNVLVSPLSVLCALALVANGAEGETLAQMETMMGMSVDELNAYLSDYINSLPQDEKYKLSLANSVWYTNNNSFTVNEEFLQTNADYYNADIHQAAFDQETLQDINNWVNDKTDGMIPSILEDISPDAVMYLINALAFEAEWASVYTEEQVRDGQFTTEDGVKQDVEFMYGTEDHYIADDYASGFIKYYKHYRYAFVALLPDEGVSVSDYLATLNGESLHAMLTAPRQDNVVVHTAIPKFETEYAVEMSDILKSMGMTDAFDESVADLSGLGTSAAGRLFISNVMHKTYIQVGEQGTRAGAATSVELEAGSGPMEIVEMEVYLDRPFVYMLIDCENDIPFFIGTVMSVE